MAAIAASKTSDRRIVFEAARAITTTRINIRAVPLMPFGIALRPDSQNRLDWPIYSPCMSSACPAAASRFPLARIGITRSSTTAFACWCSERRHGLQASGSTLSRRPAEALDQGEEPEAPRLRARQRIFLMTSCMLSLTALGLIHSEAAEPSAKRVAGGDGCSSGVSKPIRTASFLVIL